MLANLQKFELDARAARECIRLSGSIGRFLRTASKYCLWKICFQLLCSKPRRTCGRLCQSPAKTSLFLWFRYAYRRINSWQAGDPCTRQGFERSATQAKRIIVAESVESEQVKRSHEAEVKIFGKRRKEQRGRDTRQADRDTRSLKKTSNQSTLKPHDSKMEPDQTPKGTDGKGRTPSKGKCKYCGNQMHRKRRDCPAFGQVCRKCNKSNHFASVCNAKRSNSVNVGLNEDNSDSDLSVLQVETASTLAGKGKQVLTKLRTQTTLSSRNPWFVSWTLEHCVTWSAIETSQFFYRTGSLK